MCCRFEYTVNKTKIRTDFIFDSQLNNYEKLTFKRYLSVLLRDKLTKMSRSS